MRVVTREGGGEGLLGKEGGRGVTREGVGEGLLGKKG